MKRESRSRKEFYPFKHYVDPNVSFIPISDAGNIIAGSEFWRFDHTQKPPVRNTYPKAISSWEGIPDNLDAVLTFDNGFTYFFKKGLYYRFDDFSFAVSASH